MPNLRAEKFANELPIVEDENEWARLYYGCFESSYGNAEEKS